MQKRQIRSSVGPLNITPHAELPFARRSRGIDDGATLRPQPQDRSLDRPAGIDVPRLSRQVDGVSGRKHCVIDHVVNGIEEQRLASSGHAAAREFNCVNDHGQVPGKHIAVGLINGLVAAKLFDDRGPVGIMWARKGSSAATATARDSVAAYDDGGGVAVGCTAESGRDLIRRGQTPAHRRLCTPRGEKRCRSRFSGGLRTACRPESHAAFQESVTRWRTVHSYLLHGRHRRTSFR